LEEIMRKIITAILILFVIGIVGIFIINYYPQRNANLKNKEGIEIIGGSDGPTAIFTVKD